MRPDEFWKNFKLGSELDIAGRFIYNGLKAFDDMETFYFEEDAFEFLYNISVGIERLFKIWIILVEHDSISDQGEFERSLITHNHSELARRISAHADLKFGKVHNKFLALLTSFYKTHRYDRYSFTSFSVDDKEKDALIGFLETELSIEIDTTTPFAVTRNDPRIKKFIGKIIGKICERCYDGINDEAHRLNIYTYEIPTFSKAFKIFLSKEYTFDKEKAFSREMLVYLLKRKDKGSNSKVLSELEPLDFDPAMEADYFEAIESDLKKLRHIDELEHCYIEDVENPRERLEHLGAATAQIYDFDDDEEE